MGEFGGQLWQAAEREGRVPPGRGPLYTRRVLPTRLPVTRRELTVSGVSRRSVAKYHEQVSRGVYLPPVPEKYLRHARLGPAGHHADTGLYRHDIVTRARAHSFVHPRAVVAYWSAAAYHGLVHWADEAPVVLRPLPSGIRTVRPDRAFPGLRVVDAATAAVQCLTTIISGKRYWPVPHVEGLRPEQVRAV